MKHSMGKLDMVGLAKEVLGIPKGCSPNVGRLHAIAATSNEEDGPVLSEIADAFQAELDAALQSATELGPCGKHWKGDWVPFGMDDSPVTGYCRTCAEINQLREQRDNALTELTEVRGFWKAARDGALERTAAAMAQQRGTIANWFKSNPIYISVVNTNLLVKDILAVPLASAESQEWLEKHDVEVAKAWVAHTRDAHQAELRQQLAMARLDEAKWWIAMQKLDIADLFGDEEHRYKQLESEAQAREGEVKS